MPSWRSGSWAHPRSRGENPRPVMKIWGFAGSSPLTRGKLAISLAADYKLGLIPAHAGKTNGNRVDQSMNPAHPRSRGENSPKSAPSNVVQGSSPLTRGKLLHPRWGHRRQGLIPAHAGKTYQCTWRRDWRGAHPRSRGENPPTATAPSTARGSSPLTRGKPERRGRWQCRHRLIPAHAGKTEHD